MNNEYKISRCNNKIIFIIKCKNTYRITLFVITQTYCYNSLNSQKV